MRAREPGATRTGRLLSLSGELRVAYALCHGLRVMHRRGKAGWWDGMPSEIDKWRSLARRSGIPELVRRAATTRRNQVGILDGHKFGRTNAVAEGIDNSIKVTKRRGCGIRRFEASGRGVPLVLGLGRVEATGPSMRDVGAER